MPEKEDEQFQRLSKDLVMQIAVVVKTAQIHDPTNVAVMSAIKKLVETINALLASGSAMLEIIGDYFYLNGTRVKFPMEYLVNFDYLSKEFKKHSLGSITFLDSITAEEMQSFLKAYIASSSAEDQFAVLSSSIEQIRGIRIGTVRKILDEEQNKDARKVVKKTYFNAVSFSKGVFNKIYSGEKLNVKRSKRIVQSLVDTLLSEEELLLGMTAIKDYDDYTYHHCVNVSILSMSLGQKIGFDKHTLLELGLVALFHDVGKINIPQDVLNKPSSFTEDEWKIMQRHPYWGVRSILGMKGIDALSIRTAIVAFEHHQHLDHSGYPKVRGKMNLDLYSRIVSVADQYDSMTSARVYMRGPLQPDKALSLMLERSGTQLDPLLIKFFINMVGVYPIGTAVMLDTNELGLVCGNNTAFPDRPKVLVISDPKGTKVQGYSVDLSEKVRTGQYKRSIAKTLDPYKYKFNLAEYLL